MGFCPKKGYMVRARSNGEGALGQLASNEVLTDWQERDDIRIMQQFCMQ